MAGLKDAPKEAVTKPSSPSSDDNAADQQLLTESHSPTASRPSSSAVLGANLLNAARINVLNSSAPSMMRKNGLGKLKRVSIVSESSKQNLATRGDPYEIELSPEKGRYALPEKVNHKRLKINRKKKKETKVVKKKEKAAEEQSEVPVASSELPVHAEAEPQVEADERVEDLALAMVEIRSSPPEFAPPESAQRAPEVPPSETAFPGSEDVNVDATGKPEDHTNTQGRAKRKSGSDHSADQPTKILREQRQTTGGPTSTKKRHPQVLIPVRRSSQSQDATNATGHNDAQRTQESGHVDSAQAEASHSDTAAQKPKARKKRTNESTVSSQRLPAQKRGAQRRAESPKEAPAVADATETETAPVADESEHGSGAEGSESAVGEIDETVRPRGRPGSIEAVFEFLNLEARPGKCKTTLATSIRRACNTYSAHLRESDLFTDTVGEDADELQEALRQISTLEEKDQRAFKGDAYGHVFRALTLYLEGLYTSLYENGGKVTESLEAMRILSPLIHQILAFKDTIAEWDVSVPKRYKGERIIKDVDTSLITHLRQVAKKYRGCLSRLKAKDELRQLQVDFERQMKEKEEEEDRRAKLVEARTERWKRWQALHIVRLKCEPDPRRRVKLAITRLEDLEERDANGVVFERLPVFKSRSAPPHRQASALDNKPGWTEQEETALLDGLRHCAGPNVFEKIFTTYCRPDSPHSLGGHLRERSVADIVTRAAQFRSDLQEYYQSNGWEVEGWVTRIPALP